MRFGRSRRTRRVAINITSLIDVLFLLLIFLMVSSTFLEQPGIQLDLPQADTATPTEQKDYTIFVDGRGRVFLNQEEVPLDRLEEKLRGALAEMKDGAVQLNADRSSQYGVVVKVMDTVKKSGVRRLIVATKLEE